MKSKAFENMRYNISREMQNFEEEKSNYFRSATPHGNLHSKPSSATATFVQESRSIDPSLLKRDVSPLKVNNSTMNLDKAGASNAFNLEKYMNDLDKKFSRVNNED